MQNRTLIGLLSALGICFVAGCETEFQAEPAGNGGTAATSTSNAGMVSWDDPISGASGATAGTQTLPTDGGIAPPATGGGIAPPLTGGIGGGTAGAGGPVGGGGVAGEVAGSAGSVIVPPDDSGVVVEPPVEQACPAAPSLTPGEITVSLQVGGRTRSFILHVPASYNNQPEGVPLVIDWHGILLSSGLERAISGWADVADREGFIVAFPEGIDTAFNLGICCTTDRNIDDLALGRAIVDQIRQRGCIDPKRIHSVGYSLGGGLAMHMACNAADLFASVATSAFDLIWEQDYQCNPSRPIAIMSFRNTGDPICPYTGGATWPPNGLPVVVNFMGAEATFTKWSQLNGCSGTPAAGTGGCPTYTQCAEGVEVTLCTDVLQTMGHGWMDASTGWEFLKRHPKP